MDEESQTGDPRTLEQARQTIARQAEEIQRLRRRVADERFAEELRSAFRLAATLGTIASPVSHSRLLEMIVETAADVIQARSASLFLVDEEAQELVFEVALGPKAAEAKKFRVPLGHGIAGLVAVTAQPMVVSEAQSDPRQAADLAIAIGYIPRSILCVPLFYNGLVIGVLELLDREGARAFDAEDMETLGLFARQAAVAIQQSRSHDSLSALVREVLASLDGVPDDQRRALAEPARAFAAAVEEDAATTRCLELARLVQEIVHQGEREFETCRAILLGFAEYLRPRPDMLKAMGTKP